MIASQEHLLPKVDNILKPQHEPSLNFKPVRALKKEDCFADKSPDLKHLSRHPPP
jgi:hypothetical protein